MQWYMDHSPLTYAQDVHMPLFIMHAENALRCLIEQAEQLLIALKKQRKTVVCFRQARLTYHFEPVISHTSYQLMDLP